MNKLFVILCLSITTNVFSYNYNQNLIPRNRAFDELIPQGSPFDNLPQYQTPTVIHHENGNWAKIQPSPREGYGTIYYSDGSASTYSPY